MKYLNLFCGPVPNSIFMRIFHFSRPASKMFSFFAEFASKMNFYIILSKTKLTDLCKYAAQIQFRILGIIKIGVLGSSFCG
jgi:hypothetical protein